MEKKDFLKESSSHRLFISIRCKIIEEIVVVKFEKKNVIGFSITIFSSILEII